MLVKCVCSNCGHSYLSDDESGNLACPRCDSGQHGSRKPALIHNDPVGLDQVDFPDNPFMEDLQGGEELYETTPSRFEAMAPPPMYLTRERLFRGLVVGSLVTAALAAVLGGIVAAVAVDVPAVSAIAIALVGGAACRSAFGGRSARQTRGRALVVVCIAILVSFAGYLGGSWAVERLSGSRARQTQEELDSGLKGLLAQHGDSDDAGVSVLLKQRIEEAQRLRALSDSQLEDYLWVQQAQLNQPLLAYAKLRFTETPVVRLGPDSDPVTLEMGFTLGIRVAELLLAMILAARAVRPR